MRTNHIIIPDSAYLLKKARFALPTSTIERFSGMAFPHWGLAITNRVVAIIKEPGPGGRIIDYVQLNGVNTYRDLTLDIADPPPGNSGIGGFKHLWATNSLPGQPTFLSDFPGVYQQILVSGGTSWGFSPGQDWQNYGLNQPSGQTRDQAIANFLAFF